MSDFIVKVEAETVIAALEKLATKAGAAKPALENIAQMLLTRVALSFRSSVDPYGGAWAKLKRRKGQPLIDTGRLRSSMTSEVTDTSVTIGTNTKYAAVHQFGYRFNVKARIGTHHKKIKKDGQFAKGGRFVKKKNSNIAIEHNVGAHQVTIPARPFLPILNGKFVLPDSVQKKMTTIIKRHLGGDDE